MADDSELRLRVTDHSEEFIKLIWETSTWDVHYNVPRTLVNDCAQAVRVRLTTLIAQIRAQGADNCGTELKSLSRAGHDLFLAIFHDVDQRPATREVQAILEDPAKHFLIRIMLEVKMHIPWGLLCSAVKEDEDPGTRISDYGDLWCLKHKIAALYFRIQPRFTADRIPIGKFELVPVLNRSVHEKVESGLGIDQAEKDTLAWYAQFAPAFSKKHLFQRWSTVNKKYAMLYFLCHASSSKLELSDTDALTATEWMINLVKDSDDHESACVAFVNGCLTATAAASSTFLEASAERGFIGFIGTEAKVPNLFAQRFGLSFLKCFLTNGESLVDTMDHVRRAHWPLSVLYSVYCFPHMRIVHDVKPPSGAALANASLSQLGTDDL